jgi:hypothetical protein
VPEISLKITEPDCFDFSLNSSYDTSRFLTSSLPIFQIKGTFINSWWGYFPALLVVSSATDLSLNISILPFLRTALLAVNDSSARRDHH